MNVKILGKITQMSKEKEPKNQKNTLFITKKNSFLLSPNKSGVH